jgi:hypothetical protein
MRTVDRAIAASEYSGILICGAAGVGKSRIAREALAAAASRGCDIRWTAGTSSAREIPLGAFSAWAPSGVTDTVQLLRGVIESLTAKSSGADVILGVDDVHLLDDLSTFVVHQIVQRGAARVVLTVRDGAPIPAAIQDLWTAGQFDRIDLAQLSLDQTTALLAASLGGSVDAEAAARLFTLTRGNVLYLRNIVEQEVADGRILQEHGCWRWIGDPIMPPGLMDLIESRIGALPTPVSDVVDHRRRGRGGRRPRPHHAGARRRWHRGTSGASAVWPGAPQTRCANPAPTTSRTRRHRTRSIERP